MAKIKFNKKAIGFFSLIGVFTLILFALYVLTITKPLDNIPKDIDFSKTIVNIDILNNMIPAQMLYKKEEVKLSFDNNRKQFAGTLGLSTSQFFQRTQTGSDLLGCRYSNLELWYNEKNIDENIKIKEQKQSETQSNLEEYSTCEVNFNDDLEERLENFLYEKLSDEISQVLITQGIEKLPIVELDYDKEKQLINANIKTQYLQTTKVTNLQLNLDYDVEYNLGNFPELLRTMSLIIPQIPYEVKEKVPECLKENMDADQIFCINKTIIGLINNRNEDLLIDYEFKIDFIKEIENPNYYGLEFIILKKSTQKSELNFGIILKDNIPHLHVNFELKHFLGYDNVIDVVINEPKFSSKVTNYVVFYSYDNFFRPDFKDYDKLVNLLNENKIPSNFENIGMSSQDQYFYSKEMDISLVLSNNKNFVRSENEEQGKKTISIYQIYDRNEKKFKLLDRPVHVFVFATDSNYNYYVSEIEGKTKSIMPIRQFGPNPMKEVSATADIMDYQNTINFQIKNYKEKFNNLDLYILGEGGKISEFCNGDDLKCHYFSAKNLNMQSLDENGGLNLLISSDAKDKGSFDALILTSDFSNNLVLENEKKYTLFVVPVDSQNKGVILTTSVRYSLRQIETDEISYHVLENVQGETKVPARVENLVVKDRKAPNPLTSIKINGIRPGNDNYLILDWTRLENDVEKLSVNIITRDNEGNVIHNNVKREIGIDGRIIEYKNFNSIIINEIIPVDNSLNKAGIDSQTHIATFGG